MRKKYDGEIKILQLLDGAKMAIKMDKEKPKKTIIKV